MNGIWSIMATFLGDVQYSQNGTVTNPCIDYVFSRYFPPGFQLFYLSWGCYTVTFMRSHSRGGQVGVYPTILRTQSTSKIGVSEELRDASKKWWLIILLPIISLSLARYPLFSDRPNIINKKGAHTHNTMIYTVHTHIYIHTCIHTCTHAHTHIYIYILYAHNYIYIYKYMIPIRVQIQSYSRNKQCTNYVNKFHPASGPLNLWVFNSWWWNPAAAIQGDPRFSVWLHAGARLMHSNVLTCNFR